MLRRNFDDAELVGVAGSTAAARKLCEDDWSAGYRGRTPDRILRWDDHGAYVIRGKRRIDVGYEIERTTVQ